jgi:glycosyltransferase involved in cell wall biosynthesis
LKKPFVVKIVGDYAWEQGTQRFGVTETLDEFQKNKNVPQAVKFLQKIERRVAKNAVRIIVPSDYLKGIVMSWGVPEGKIQRIYNGIEVPREIPSPKKREGEFLIVSTGRRVPWKGFEALEHVAQKHASGGWRLFIASDLPRAEALGWVRAADVFVLNSTYEGLSHALIEAMTLGTPVIATSAGGNTTLVIDGKTGILIPPQDDSALEGALQNVASDPAKARERAFAGQKSMENFSVSHMISETATLLTTLV